MKKIIPLTLLVAVLVGLSMALVLSLTGGSGGRDSLPGPLSAVQDGAPPEPESQEPLAKAAFNQPASNDGSSEGIKVHGHWTIEVREPDGRLVNRREFDNALTDGGRRSLSQILNRLATIGSWQVLLFNTTSSNQPCVNSSNEMAACSIVEASDSHSPASNYFKNLVITNPSQGVNAGNLVLTGTATASRTGAVDEVQTLLHFCSITETTANCPGGTTIGFTRFSRTNLDSAISVQEGQLIVVEVIIEFR